MLLLSSPSKPESWFNNNSNSTSQKFVASTSFKNYEKLSINLLNQTEYQMEKKIAK